VEGKTKGHFKMERRDKASDVVLVASEPLTFERHNWLAVPTNTIVTICNQTVFVRPIKDEFYDPDPAAERSSGFAQSKGLVTKAPGGGIATPSTNGAVTPLPACALKLNSGVGGKETLDELNHKVEKLHVLRN
jgi:glutamine amidotransferase